MVARGIGLAFAAFILIAQTAGAHDSGFGLARYLPDGSLDRTFGTGGVVVIRSAESTFVANALTLQPDGKIVIGGMTSDLANASLRLALARYNADGTPDQTFGEDGLANTPVGPGGAEANSLLVNRDGSILVVGTAFAHGDEDDEFFVARFTALGALDTGFGTGGITTTHVGAAGSSASALVVLPDGHVLVAGTAFSNGPTDDDFALVRYTRDGRLDQTFGSSGIVTADFGSGGSTSLDRAGGLALQPDGRIVIAGFTRGERQAFAVARYQSDGQLDATFGSGGKTVIPAREAQLYSVIIQPTHDIVLAGSSAAADQATAPFTLVRLHPEGGSDETFGSGGIVTTSFEGSRSGARAVVAQPDGRLISGGAKFGAPSAQGDAVPNSGFALARYNADGSIDATFGSGGRTLTDMGDAGATPLALAVQPDGRILAAGLVFFQVPVATSSGPRDFVLRFGAPVVLVGLALVAISVGAMLSRRSKK